LARAQNAASTGGNRAEPATCQLRERRPTRSGFRLGLVFGYSSSGLGPGRLRNFRQCGGWLGRLIKQQRTDYGGHEFSFPEALGGVVATGRSSGLFISYIFLFYPKIKS
jgi:hypothetical protein